MISFPFWEAGNICDLQLGTFSREEGYRIDAICHGCLNFFSVYAAAAILRYCAFSIQRERAFAPFVELLASA